MQLDENEEQYAPTTTGSYLGKFEGVVLDNEDPLGLARLLVKVPAVPDATELWARPCVPYGGDQVGLHLLPEVDASVWVEFAAGDPSYPIWCGIYWPEAETFELPQKEGASNPLIKVLKTVVSTLQFDDTDKETDEGGSVFLELGEAAVEVPVTMTFNNQGVELKCGPCSLVMNPEEGITITMGEEQESTITMTAESIEIKSPTITDLAGDGSAKVNLAAEGIDVEGNAVALKGSTLDASADGSATLQGGGSVDVSAGGALGLSGSVVNLN